MLLLHVLRITNVLIVGLRGADCCCFLNLVHQGAAETFPRVFCCCFFYLETKEDQTAGPPKRKNYNYNPSECLIVHNYHRHDII